MNVFHTGDGSSISYLIAGSGKPIIFIHGWSVDFRLWFNKIESIEGSWKDRYSRIYFDLPGMGKSIGARTIRNSDDMLKDIIEFIGHTVGDSPYLLAGESYGGYLARGLLIGQARRIEGLILLCPLVIPGNRQGRISGRVVLEKDGKFLESLSREDRNEFEYLSVIQNQQMWQEYKEDIHLERLEENAGFLERLSGGFRTDINSIDLEYDKPVLLLVGRQDSEVGFEQQYELYRKFPRATIMILDKAGHNLQIERRKMFACAFLDFIERVETVNLKDGTASGSD
jgi:pimeloyl-ACP methyl ester carboxylesterase